MAFAFFAWRVHPGINLVKHKRGSRGQKGLTRFAALLFFALILLSCQTAPNSAETVLPVDIPAPAVTPRPPTVGGVADEIRLNTETGTPPSLLASLEIILSRNLTSTEFGRTMLNVNAVLLDALYPAIHTELPRRDPPITHSYSIILREAERGIYLAPQRSSPDFLEHVLPFLAYYPPFNGRSFPSVISRSVIQDLEKAAQLNRHSALANYFLGYAYEHTGLPDNALAHYSLAWEAFPDCYPAALGVARVMAAQGREEEAVHFLSDLSALFPYNMTIRRQLASAYYDSGDWQLAEATAAEILEFDSHDGEFLLMRAHILIEQGDFLQARAPLEIYAEINPTNTLYLFLRARIQNDFYHNRESALNYLRTILSRSTPADAIYQEAAVYAVRLLMGSPLPREHTEGMELLRRLISVPRPSLEVVSLALWDAVRRESWAEAESHLGRLLEERRSFEDLLAAYAVEIAQGNNDTALSYAQELYNQNRSNEEGLIAYISALIAVGRRSEAAGMIDNRLAGIGGGELKSRYHYLRSRTRNTEDAIMSDLRSSLFENPRNLDALIATFEVYHQRNDERRALHYLRQALALAPDNLRLQRYAVRYGL